MKVWLGIVCSITAVSAADTSSARIEAAAAKTVTLIQKSQKTWYTKQNCLSCHQQVLLGRLAFRAAREHGMVDESAAHADVAAFDIESRPARWNIRPTSLPRWTTHTA